VASWRCTHSPSPSPPASPTKKHSCRVYSLRSLRSVVAPVAPVANPLSNGSKGEEQPPPRGRVLHRSKKRKPPCLRFLHRQGGVLPPHRQDATTGRTPPTRLFVLHHAMPNPPHGKARALHPRQLRSRHITRFTAGLPQPCGCNRPAALLAS